MPSLETLRTAVGWDKGSTAFAAFLKQHDFSENPKREDSWGSAFGVMIELRDHRWVMIGIRPLSSGTNLPTYGGLLPGGLQSGDSIEAIITKLGEPIKIIRDGNAMIEMVFDGLTVVTLRDELFEIWLTEPTKEL